jgi:hypothetical protein
MKESIQSKINRIHAISKLPSKSNLVSAISSSAINNDSLLKSIRNPKESAIFMAELNTVIKSGSIKK